MGKCYVYPSTHTTRALPKPYTFWLITLLQKIHSRCRRSPLVKTKYTACPHSQNDPSSLLVFLLPKCQLEGCLCYWRQRGEGLDPISTKGPRCWASFSMLFLEGKKNDLTSSSSSSSSLSSCRSLSSLCAAATAWSNYRWFKMSSLRRAKFKYWIPISLSPSESLNSYEKVIIFL